MRGAEVCGGAWQGPGVPQRAQKRGSCYWLGPGNTNLRVLGGYWVGTTPPRHPPGTPPLVHRSPYTADATLLVHAAPALTAVSGGPKEILGVDNAQVGTGNGQGTHGLCRPPAATSRPCSPAPPCAPAPCSISLFSVISQLYLSYTLVLDPCIR